MRQTAKISGYSADPGKPMAKWGRRKFSILLPRSSSKVALQALATLEVPAENHPIKQDMGGPDTAPDMDRIHQTKSIHMFYACARMVSLHSSWIPDEGFCGTSCAPVPDTHHVLWGWILLKFFSRGGMLALYYKARQNRSFFVLHQALCLHPCNMSLLFCLFFSSVLTTAVARSS